MKSYSIVVLLLIYSFGVMADTYCSSEAVWKYSDDTPNFPSLVTIDGFDSDVANSDFVSSECESAVEDPLLSNYFEDFDKSELSIKYQLDLNDDGVCEYIISTGGARSGYALSVFENDSGEIKSIGQLGYVYTLEIREKSNGYYQLSENEISSGAYHSISVFSFNGKSYERAIGASFSCSGSSGIWKYEG